MLNHIINFSLNQRIFVFFGLLVLIVTGVISFKNLPVEAFPDVTDIQAKLF
jgi:cobalt-zinc-cadmium resistance protein CzcA